MQYQVNSIFLAHLLLLQVFAFPCFADMTQLAQKTFSGQPSGLIHAVHQGRDTLWVGSENGLFAITGKHVKHYGNEHPGLGRGEVWSLAEDQNGLLWIATLGNGLLVFDKVQQRFFYPGNFDVSEHNYCRKVDVSLSNKVYAACGKGLLSIDTQSFDITNLVDHFDPYSSAKKGALVVAVDMREDIWFANSNDGVFRFEEKTGSLHHYLESKSSLSGNKVSSIFVDSTGLTWVGTEAGVNVFNSELNKFEKLSGVFDEQMFVHEITTFFEDHEGKIWIVSDEVYVVDKTTNKVIRSDQTGLLSNDKELKTLRAVSTGEHGNILISSNTHGLISISQLAESVDYLEFFVGGVVYSIEKSIELHNGGLLIATKKGFYLGGSYRDISLLANKDDYVENMIQLGNDKILIAFERGGLAILDIKTGFLNDIDEESVGLPNNIDHTFFGLAEDSGEAVYIGVFGKDKPGVYVGKINDSFIKLGGNLQVDNLLMGEDGKIWVATRRNGVFFLNQDKTWHEVKDPRRGKGYLINYCVVEDNSGNIWLCTNGEGLGYVGKENDYIEYIDPDLTAGSRFIRDIVQDFEGYFWVTTNRGLVRYDHRTGTSIKLGKEEGVYDLDFEITASSSLSRGKVLIAGDKKSYIINTKQVNDYLNLRQKRQTRAQLVDLFVSEREKRERESHSWLLFSNISANRPLELTYDQFLFTLEFAANDYAERNVLGFEYRLLGLNDNWIEVSSQQTTATYSTLPAGMYDFQVRVIDPKSLAEQPITSLKIRVLPPFWRTLQAYLFYAIVVCLVLFAFHKYRTRKLKEINQTLEKSVAKRTSELAASNAQVCGLLKQKQNLFASVSHELRTPLSLVVGPLEKLRADLHSDEQLKHFDMIYRNTRRLTNLVDQVLELAKLDSIKERPKHRYSVDASVKVLVESFRPLAESKSQRVTLFNHYKGVLALSADSFEVMLSNLLSNAIKYSPAGGTILVESERKGESYLLSVSDSGSGIAVDDQERVFDRFTRLENASQHVGSGIGLAVVKELVEANGGSVSVTSETDQGACFRISLPLLKHDIAEEATVVTTPVITLDDYFFNHESEQQVIQETNSLGRRTVLIVEDNQDMRSFIHDCLSEHYHCELAVDGEQGLSQAKMLIPDVIVSDLMMPIKDGFELAEAIRADETTYHIPIVLLTAKGDDQSRIEGWQKNVDDYIGKPFNAQELVLRVQRLLSIRDIISKRVGRDLYQGIEAGQQLKGDGGVRFSHPRDKKFYERFVEIIGQHYTEATFARKDVAGKMAMSERQLNRKLAALMDHNFSDFLRKYRLEKAKAALLEGNQITEVSYDVGFSSPSYFSSCFKAEFGCTPKRFVEKSFSSLT